MSLKRKIPLLIDSHAHLNFPEFNKDRNALIDQSLDEGIWMINVGTDFQSSRLAAEIAQQYTRGVYCSLGLHPIYVGEEDYSQESMGELASNNEKVVAIGEIGLDYYHILNEEGKLKDLAKVEKTKKKQQIILFKQLELARMLNLPVIFHCRCFKGDDAYRDLLKVLEKFSTLYKDYILRGVMHCYTGNLELAKIYQKLGMYLGMTGVVTFSKQYDKMIKSISSDRILVETDCPYLAPQPKRGERNVPFFVKYTAQHLARIREVREETFFSQTVKNTQELFQLNNY